MITLQEHGLFNTMEDIQQAYQYIDDLVNTLEPHDRITALTAVYVLYNAAVNHYNKQLEEEDGKAKEV